MKQKIIFLRYLFFCIVYFNSNVLFSNTADKYKDNLILNYDFNSIKNDMIVDKSGRNNHGKVKYTHDSILDNIGITGHALHFHKKTKLLVSTNNMPKNFKEFTIMMWVKPHELEGIQTLISKRSHKNEFSFFSVNIADNQSYGTIGHKDVLESSVRKGHLVTQEWSFLAFTFKDGFLTFYIDGIMASRIETKLKVCGVREALFSIGSDFEGTESFYHGLMDDLYVFDKAVLASDILREYNLIMSVDNMYGQKFKENPTIFLVASLPMNEGKGDVINNIVDTHYNGLLSDGMGTYWKAGFKEKTLFFKGKGDVVRIQAYNKLNFEQSFTILCWVKPFKFNNRSRIIHKFDPNPKRFYLLGADKGLVYGGIGNGEKTKYIKVDDQYALTLNNWNEIGIIYDYNNQTLSLIVNGKNVKTIITGVSSHTHNFDLLIGGVTGHGFSGEIKDLRLYNIVVPEKYIENKYNDFIEVSKQRNVRSAAKATIKTKFHSMVRDLNDIYEYLGVEDDLLFELVAGKESESLAEIEKYIKIQRKIYNLEKKRINIKYSEAKSSIIKLVESLNLILKESGDPIYVLRIPKIGKWMTIEDSENVIKRIKKKEIQVTAMINKRRL